MTRNTPHMITVKEHADLFCTGAVNVYQVVGSQMTLLMWYTLATCCVFRVTVILSSLSFFLSFSFSHPFLAPEPSTCTLGVK